MFSEHVLGTRAFILRALWNVLGTHSFKVENGTHLGLRSMTYCVTYTAQRVRSFWCALSVLIAVCVLSPAHLEHCSRYTSVHTCFGCVLRGRFVPRTWFDHVPAGTVLAGTILFRTRSDYKKWCVPRTCSENMFPLELYREQVWTPGRSPLWVDMKPVEMNMSQQVQVAAAAPKVLLSQGEWGHSLVRSGEGLSWDRLFTRTVLIQYFPACSNFKGIGLQYLGSGCQLAIKASQNWLSRVVNVCIYQGGLTWANSCRWLMEVISFQGLYQPRWVRS